MFEVSDSGDGQRDHTDQPAPPQQNVSSTNPKSTASIQNDDGNDDDDSSGEEFELNDDDNNVKGIEMGEKGRSGAKEIDNVEEDEDDNDKDKPSSKARETNDVTKRPDDDEEEEEIRKDAPTAATTTAEEKKSTVSGLFDDSDDDDDEAAEFDDVVGSSAPPEEKTKKVGRAADATAPKDGGILRVNEGSTAKVSKAKQAQRPPQHATVLEADRPGPGVSLYTTKLPNLVGIQPIPFDVATYDAKEEEEHYNGYVHNMIRWRFKRDENGSVVRDKNGRIQRESNSKLVKWSDGSLSLHIGSEAFDIQAIDSSSNGFPGLNGYVYLSQRARFSKGEKGDGDEDEDDDGLQQSGGGTVLECVGPVVGRLVPKPSSLQSEAHKSLTIAVRQRTIKKARIAEYVTEEDPEKAKQDRIRTNTDADKQRQRKRAQASAGGYRAAGGRRPGMNRSYMEAASDDEQYDSINIRALKKGTTNYEDEMDDYGEDSDDGYGDTFMNRSRKRQRKDAQEEESDEEEEMVLDDDDDEEEIKIIKKNKAQSSNVLDDDDE
jgi:RNA polymerase-associated protein LEO1